jgi:transcriptional regulator with XRE-family HTH domain
MTSIGQQLRSARVGKKLTVQQIAAETLISSRYLEAIESDDLKSLPGGVYYRVWVKQYAGLVGLDYEKLRPLMATASEPEPIRLPIPAAPSTGDRLLETLSISLQRAFKTPAPQLIGLALVLAVGGFVFSQWSDRSEVSRAQQEEQAKAIAASAPANVLAADMTSMELPPGKLQVVAIDDVWLSVSSAGKPLYSGLMGKGEKKSFDIEQAYLHIGNAAGLQISWKGQDLGSLGNRGQVKQVVILNDRWKILQALPPAPKEPETEDSNNEAPDSETKPPVEGRTEA